MAECEHHYGYLGVRYHDGTETLPGSGATTRYYAHVFFCNKCLRTHGNPIEDPYRTFHSYEKPRFEALPGTAEECGVPMSDRSNYRR